MGRILRLIDIQVCVNVHTYACLMVIILDKVMVLLLLWIRVDVFIVLFLLNLTYSFFILDN